MCLVVSTFTMVPEQSPPWLPCWRMRATTAWCVVSRLPLMIGLAARAIGSGGVGRSSEELHAATMNATTGTTSESDQRMKPLSPDPPRNAATSPSIRTDGGNAASTPQPGDRRAGSGATAGIFRHHGTD